MKDDYELLQQGMVIYDALYSWAKHIQHVKHTENPVGNFFIEVLNKFIKNKPAQKLKAFSQ